MNYRVTAYGMFGQLTEPSRPIENPLHTKQPVSPSVISHYSEEHPASLMPFLVWHSVPNAVCYEVELLTGKPAQEGGTAADKNNHLESTQLIFTNGWQADLKKYANRKFIYWRVRALDIHHQPIGEFSPTEELYIDANLPQPNHPLLNEYDQMPNFEMPIYPVYQWIPLHNIERYEVELMIHPPAAENDNVPTADALRRRLLLAGTGNRQGRQSRRRLVGYRSLRGQAAARTRAGGSARRQHYPWRRCCIQLPGSARIQLHHLFRFSLPELRAQRRYLHDDPAAL